MGFYGRIVQSSSQNLQFDRTYPNKYIMDQNCNNDNVFMGRIVLIDYENNPSDGSQYSYITITEENTNGNENKILYIGLTFTNYYKDNEKEPSTIHYYIQKNNDNTLKLIGKEEDITNTDSVEKYSTTFDLNQAIDKAINFNLGRGYDQTAWKKTQIDDKVKYIHLADLNSVVPEIDFLQDPPTSVPMKPHYDEDNTNVKYTLHTQPTWGFRIANNQGFASKKKQELAGFEANKYYSDKKEIYSEDQWNQLNNKDIVYYKVTLPSDEEIEPWEKAVVTIDDTQNYSVSTQYANSLEEVDKHTKDTSKGKVSKPKWQDEKPKDKIQAAIYYNKAGFDPKTKSKVEDANDAIKITPAYSGNYYNTVPSKGPGGEELYEDVQELSINLPSIGNAISDVWDIVYGPNRSYAPDNEDYTAEQREEDKESLCGYKDSLNLENGEGNYSMIQKGSNNKATTDYSIAFGENNEIGGKGLDIANIDTKNKTITFKSSISGNNWESSDKFTLILGDDVYIDCGTISSIDTTNNTIVYTEDALPVTSGIFFVPLKTAINDIKIENKYGTVIGGQSNAAIGQSSFVAGGRQNIALGKYSHAEGRQTIASYAAHSEGLKTKAIGSDSHAEGAYTIASGEYSHSEGYETKANADYSHAEGGSTIANGEFSHSEGNNTQANGNNSHAEGAGTTATGANSHAEGKASHANGISSHAEGQYSIANGNHQHVQGRANIEDKEGVYAHIVGNGEVEDNGNLRSRSNAYTLDWEGNARFAGNVYIGGTQKDDELKQLITKDDINTKSGSGKCSVITNWFQGTSMDASGEYSHAEGGATLAEGKWSHSEGQGTEAKGLASHAEGQQTEASGECSHAEGCEAIASGNNSHAEGYKTVSSSECSHAEGNQTQATHWGTHAEGYKTQAKDFYAHAEGDSTIASGMRSHAEGNSTIADGEAQHAQGKYNIGDYGNKYADIVGNGNSINDRSNAYALDWNGNGYFSGNVYVNVADSEYEKGEFSDLKKLATVEYVDSLKPKIFTRTIGPGVWVTDDSDNQKYSYITNDVVSFSMPKNSFNVYSIIIKPHQSLDFESKKYWKNYDIYGELEKQEVEDDVDTNTYKIKIGIVGEEQPIKELKVQITICFGNNLND